jgi:hypothetical protein
MRNSSSGGQRMTVEDLRNDAARILSNLEPCWSRGSAITYTASVLVRIHPGIERAMAVAAAEQAAVSVEAFAE